MSLKTYRNIGKFFPYTENVYLSGWGEPLLNPFFVEMIQRAKKAGCSVGFTTNGELLEAPVGEKLIDLQTDVVSFSLAGATGKTHESLRRGSSFKNLTKNIRTITRLKKTWRSDKPKIILLFMMTQKNMHELSRSIEFATEVGADGVIATNLDYVALPFHDELKAFSCTKANAEFIEIVNNAKNLAKMNDVFLHAFPLEMKRVPVCSEDPLNNVYISEDGNVSPCVYLNPPLREISRIFCNKTHTIPRISFGNINEQTLFDVWNTPGYISFRRQYEQRLNNPSAKGVDTLPTVCRTCYKAHGI
jgi:MoaA/NifB/PqqE/SkfB family radical SAM enzyme